MADGVMTIALAQMTVVRGEVGRNVETASRLVRDAAARGAELVLLPELWSTGYDLARSAAYPHITRTEVLPAMSALARELGVHIAGSVLLDHGDERVFNAGLVIGPSGSILSRYDKVHLFGLMEEDRYLTAGGETATVPLSACDAGLAICYDLRFPELFLTYGLAGVPLVLVPAEWPAVRREHWRTLVRARAIENGYYVAACNCAGTSGPTVFDGHSLLVDPWGKVVLEGGDAEELLIGTVELERVHAARTTMPALGDRRPDVYVPSLHTLGVT